MVDWDMEYVHMVLVVLKSLHGAHIREVYLV